MSQTFGAHRETLLYINAARIICDTIAHTDFYTTRNAHLPPKSANPPPQPLPTLLTVAYYIPWGQSCLPTSETDCRTGWPRLSTCAIGSTLWWSFSALDSLVMIPVFSLVTPPSITWILSYYQTRFHRLPYHNARMPRLKSLTNEKIIYSYTNQLREYYNSLFFPAKVSAWPSEQYRWIFLSFVWLHAVWFPPFFLRVYS